MAASNLEPKWHGILAHIGDIYMSCLPQAKGKYKIMTKRQSKATVSPASCIWLLGQHQSSYMVPTARQTFLSPPAVEVQAVWSSSASRNLNSFGFEAQKLMKHMDEDSTCSSPASSSGTTCPASVPPDSLARCLTPGPLVAALSTKLSPLAACDQMDVWSARR